MQTPIDEILRRLGGDAAAAALTGVSPEAVRKWRSANAIPAKHWPALMAATGLAMDDFSAQPDENDVPPGATAALVLADGTVFWGRGFGAFGTTAPSELCFNTGLTGYQETLTDPSYAGQIITFTFPHIGNVGTNDEDMEAARIFARGLVVKEDFSAPSNYRSTADLGAWLGKMGIPGISGVDTRALTLRIRDLGAPNAVLAYPEDGKFDFPLLTAQAKGWNGLEGLDLAKEVSCTQAYDWSGGTWSWEHGFATTGAGKRVVAVDYGAKRLVQLRIAERVATNSAVRPVVSRPRRRSLSHRHRALHPEPYPKRPDRNLGLATTRYDRTWVIQPSQGNPMRIQLHPAVFSAFAVNYR